MLRIICTTLITHSVIFIFEEKSEVYIPYMNLVCWAHVDVHYQYLCIVYLCLCSDNTTGHNNHLVQIKSKQTFDIISVG